MPFSGCLGLEDGETSRSRLVFIQIQEAGRSGEATEQNPLPRHDLKIAELEL